MAKENIAVLGQSHSGISLAENLGFTPRDMGKKSEEGRERETSVISGSPFGCALIYLQGNSISSGISHVALITMLHSPSSGSK